jgi:flagellar FliL protein
MSEAAPTPPAAEPAPKGPATMLLALNALLLVGVLAVVVMMFLGQKKAAAAAGALSAAAEAKDGEGKDEAKAEGGEKSEGKEGKEGEKGPAKKTAAGAGPTVPLKDFVIHLRNPEADRYARISFEVEVPSDKEKDTVTAHQAQIRDAFISYLSDRTVEELRGSNGLGAVKAALMKQLIDLAPDGKIRNLYITDFVIQ